MARRRGRRPRADVAASHRVEVTLTEVEHHALRAFAAANGCSMADALRVGFLHLEAQVGEGGSAPIVVGGLMIPVIGPDDVAPEFPPGRNRDG